MDCYIVRVYRQFTQQNGEEEEIAGLVERVGEENSGKPFQSYKGLVSAMREEFSTKTRTGHDVEPSSDSACEVHQLRTRSR